MVRTEMGGTGCLSRRRGQDRRRSGEHVVPADAVVMAFWFSSTQHGMAGETQRGTGLAGTKISRRNAAMYFQAGEIFAGGDIVRGSTSGGDGDCGRP